MQYYIHYNGLHCVQKEGLVVGVPFSSIWLEIYLQYLVEDTTTIGILAKHQVSRYVDDILFIYQVS